MSINDYRKTFIDYSDHNMISVDLNIKIPKLQEKIIITSRDFRKLRRNPEFFLKELANVKWEVFRDMEDVDAMEEFWTNKINDCLDFVAPRKSKKSNRKDTVCQKKSNQQSKYARIWRRNFKLM